MSVLVTADTSKDLDHLLLGGRKIKCRLSSLICEIYCLFLYCDMASEGELLGNRRPVRERKGVKCWGIQQGGAKINTVK